MTDEKVIPLTPEEITDLFYHASTEELIRMANGVCLQMHGRAVLLRGLIEFTNVCNNDCLYCGIRHGNRTANRYRMEEKAILAVVQEGYNRGIRSFVLQGGEDPDYTTERICRLVRRIKDQGGDAAVTLSCGIRSSEEYCAMVAAGADRYLLRFETADAKLHFSLRKITLEDRLTALGGIRAAGFQVGSGYMLGLPGERAEIQLANILLCQRLQLDMVGIGPFIPHPDTPLRQARQHPLENVIRGVALLRLALPPAHIPATTAAGTLIAGGREQMLNAGANVLMPNLTPMEYKRDYLLYPNKVCLVEKGIHDLARLDRQIRSLDRELSFARGDALRLERTLR
ncbi:MAG: [FeFe] hydrogenase H-cluster radical SAM maturase HydE [Pseudomonadota bacterium]